MIGINIKQGLTMVKGMIGSQLKIKIKDFKILYNSFSDNENIYFEIEGEKYLLPENGKLKNMIAQYIKSKQDFTQLHAFQIEYYDNEKQVKVIILYENSLGEKLKTDLTL